VQEAKRKSKRAQFTPRRLLLATRVIGRQGIGMKQKSVALFRGINVGGKHLLPMAELVEVLKALKLEGIRTYIQSGNVVFDSGRRSMAALSKAITEGIEAKFGFSTKVLVMSASELRLALDENPFQDAASDPKSLHFYFLEKPPVKPNLEAIELAKSATEQYLIKGNVFYLHSPDGVGRSKLAGAVERHLGVAATARNFRTVQKLADMANQS
jgi:uncharacterized protein (DUF1697 family)